MQQSNGYIIIFSAILTVVLGGALAIASVSLKPAQKKQVELDTKRQILSAVMDLDENANVIDVYDNRIKSVVVNYDGMIVEKDEEGNELVAENIDIGKQYKRDSLERYYPVFKFMAENGQDVESYILPVYGKGLWDDIFGYLAVDGSFKEVVGVTFDHKAETPGLGARITDAEVQERFQGKKLFDEVGKLVSVQMVKGESGNPSIYDEYHVDGLSGATKTAQGVNDMLKNYAGFYQNYFNRINNGEESTTSQVIR
ncbi:NADH:ubiquinone reductase (Na(+)-transporting) subunit C [Roseivirga sp. BDSF3-8]|uniref:NADH:ubiquinone reductase (Na(+)-transporting) subunit C n=1 Tax=Roseivirga sp. BDSF3-8 TaxID=3241598 RepID=UPI003531F3C3